VGAFGVNNELLSLGFVHNKVIEAGPRRKMQQLKWFARKLVDGAIIKTSSPY